jgi:hypothetical protein
MNIPTWLRSRKYPADLAPRLGMFVCLISGLGLACIGAAPGLVWMVTAWAVGFAIEHGEESHL